MVGLEDTLCQGFLTSPEQKLHRKTTEGNSVHFSSHTPFPYPQTHLREARTQPEYMGPTLDFWNKGLSCGRRLEEWEEKTSKYKWGRRETGKVPRHVILGVRLRRARSSCKIWSLRLGINSSSSGLCNRKAWLTPMCHVRFSGQDSHQIPGASVTGRHGFHLYVVLGAVVRTLPRFQGLIWQVGMVYTCVRYWVQWAELSPASRGLCDR